MRVAAVGMSNNGRNAFVRSKRHAFAILLRLKTKRAVFVVRRVKISSGEKWPHAQPNWAVIQSGVEGPRRIALRQRSGILRLRFAPLRMTGYKAPRDENGRFSFGDEQPLLDDQIVVDPVTPARPRVIFESFDARCPIGMNYVGIVTLRRDCELAARCFHPCVEAVYEDHSSRWRRRGSQQQRVIPTGANSRD